MHVGVPASAGGNPKLGTAEEDVSVIVRFCKEAGVGHVSLNPPTVDGRPSGAALRRVKEALAQEGLAVYGGGWGFARDGGDIFDPNWRSELLTQATAIINAMGEAEVDLLTLFWRAKAEDEVAWQVMTTFHQRLVEAAEAVKVRLAVHLIPYGAVKDFATQQQLFAEIDSPYLGACYDVAIHTIHGDDFLETFRALGDKLFFPHIRNTVRGGDDIFADVIVGEGNVDLPACLRALKEVGFDGTLHIEHQKGAVEYARAVGYLKGVLAALG